jgi:hypothetical protein
LFPRRNFFKEDYSAISSHLELVQLSDINELSVNESYEFFTKNINTAVEYHIPLRKDNSSRKKKWLNNDCILKVEIEYKAWMNYLHVRSYENYKNNCKARNICTKTIRNARGEFESDIILDMKVNPNFLGHMLEIKLCVSLEFMT